MVATLYGLANRVGDRPIADDAAVDEDVLGTPHRTLIAERGDVPVNRQAASFLADFDQVGPLAEQLKESVTQAGGRRALNEDPTVAREREAHLRVAERHLRNEARDLRGFGGVGLQELAPRGKVVEEIVDRDRRPFGHTGFALGGDGSAVDLDFRARRCAPRAGPQREVRHRGDARQCFTPEAEGSNRRKVVGAGNLAGGVTLDRQPRIFRVHAIAVVFDADRLLPAELDRDADPACAGVERILDQFLDDRRRPLDNLAGGDLVGEMERQPVNAGHRDV